MKGNTLKPGKHRKKPMPSAAVGVKLRYFEEPIANVDELDLLAAPPLPGKTHPRQAMADVVPTSDDEVRMALHHPSESTAIEFESDPDAADAAADLASDLGAEFLEAATRGQDVSDVILEHDQDSTDEFIISDEEPGGRKMRGSSDLLREFGGGRRQEKSPSVPPRRAKAAGRSAPSGRSARARAR
jgi:hypothetical protein